MPGKASRRQLALLLGLVLLLAGVLAYQWRSTVAPAPSESGPVVPAAKQRTPAERDRLDAAPDVRLSALKATRPVPAANGRNLFREQPKVLPAPPRPAPPPAPDPNAPPPPPPPPPPIALKLVAIVQGSGPPIAALSDGRDVFHGREGEIIDGRYRIIKIGVESIDISYVDGRGQQRIRLAR